MDAEATIFFSSVIVLSNLFFGFINQISEEVNGEKK